MDSRFHQITAIRAWQITRLVEPGLIRYGFGLNFDGLITTQRLDGELDLRIVQRRKGGVMGAHVDLPAGSFAAFQCGEIKRHGDIGHQPADHLAPSLVEILALGLALESPSPEIT